VVTSGHDKPGSDRKTRTATGATCAYVQQGCNREREVDERLLPCDFWWYLGIEGRIVSYGLQYQTRGIVSFASNDRDRDKD